LLDLRKFIKKRGLEYKYFAIDKYRDILEVHLLIGGKKLIIFVNHWKSKSGPESERIKYAKALKKRLSIIPKNKDYIVLGDFNSNYNEYKNLITQEVKLVSMIFCKPK